MGLAIRIIPTLLHRGETLVKGVRFNAWRSVGHVQQAARIHAMRGVDELVILDIGATPEGRGPDFALVEKLTEGNFTPIAVGGGVRTIEDVEGLLRAGADKVVLGRAAVPPDQLLNLAAKKVGCQAIVVSIDIRDGHHWMNNGTFDLCLPAVTAAKTMAHHGAGEILLTSIDHEGMMEGYDLQLIEAVSQAVSIPVIAHGGCGTPQHALDAIKAGASAVAIGSMFLFESITPKDVAEYLAAQGVEVRL